MAFAVCTINLNLVMESGTRKGREVRKSLRNSMAFFYGGGTMVEENKADQETVATESEGKKRFKWQELPFVSRKSLWDPAKQISAKGDISKDLIGEEFALAYLKLMKEEWPRVGLVSLFFIARDMSRGMRLNGCSGIERAFFDMIGCDNRKLTRRRG